MEVARRAWVSRRSRPIGFHQLTGQLTDYYGIQPSVWTVGKRFVSGRLMLGVTGGAVTFLRLLLPGSNPIKLEVVLDAMLCRKASEQVTKPLIVWKIVKVETPGILVKDVELFGEAHGQELFGLEFLIADDVPRLRNGLSM